MKSINTYNESEIYILLPFPRKKSSNDNKSFPLVSLRGAAREMAEKLARPVEKIEPDLRAMVRNGLRFKREKAGVTIWRPVARLTQFHDATIA